MKDYAWKIKIADLLNNPGDTDNLNFENKFLKTQDINLGDKGIKGKISLQGLNQDEILLKINEIEFEVIYTCDKCFSSFSESYKLENLEDVRFVNPETIEIKEEIHDTLFPINMKNQTIDISELIEIIVKNEEPFVKKCKICKNPKELNKEKNQDEKTYYKIDFGKLLKS